MFRGPPREPAHPARQAALKFRGRSTRSISWPRQRTAMAATNHARRPKSRLSPWRPRRGTAKPECRQRRCQPRSDNERPRPRRAETATAGRRRAAGRKNQIREGGCRGDRAKTRNAGDLVRRPWDLLHRPFHMENQSDYSPTWAAQQSSLCDLRKVADEQTEGNYDDSKVADGRESDSAPGEVTRVANRRAQSDIMIPHPAKSNRPTQGRRTKARRIRSTDRISKMKGAIGTTTSPEGGIRHGSDAAAGA